MNIKIIFVFICIVSFFLNCDMITKSSKEKYDPRKLHWKCDTLTPIESIVGNSLDDVRLVGGGIHQYVDKEWKMENIPELDHRLLTSVMDSNGFIYAGGGSIKSSQLIMHDGTQWHDIPIDAKMIFGVWASSPSDIWIGGWQGTLQHYNGSDWTKYSIPDSVHIFEFAGYNSNDIYAIAYSTGSGGPVKISKYLYYYNGIIWQRISEFNFGDDPLFGKYGIEIIDGELYSCGDGVFKYDFETNEWTRFFDKGAIADVAGTSSDNIFAVSSTGKAYHYNGFDWYCYEDIEWCVSVWTDGKNVIMGSSLGGGVVYLGQPD